MYVHITSYSLYVKHMALLYVLIEIGIKNYDVYLHLYFLKMLQQILYL